MKKIFNLIMTVLLAGAAMSTRVAASQAPEQESSNAFITQLATGASLALLATHKPLNYSDSVYGKLLFAGPAFVGLSWAALAIASYCQSTPSKKEEKLVRFDKDLGKISDIFYDLNWHEVNDIVLHKNRYHSSYCANLKPVDDDHINSHPKRFPPQLMQEWPDVKIALKKYVWCNNHGHYRTASSGFGDEIKRIRTVLKSQHIDAKSDRQKLSKKMDYSSVALGGAGLLLIGAASIYKWWNG